MGKVSFKISKNGTRFRPKPELNPSVFVDNTDDDTTTSSVFKNHHHQLVPARAECDIDFSKKRSVVDLTEDDDDEDTDDISDEDVSFMVNIFPDGYTIDNSLKSIAAQQIALMYDPKLVRPYDRASKSLFKAIECCRVPANFFEDIPYKYKNGKVACEVRDWRKDSSEQAGVSVNNRLSVAAIPSIRRISLKMSVNSIVRDIPEMSKRDFWAYSELLETEAKILLNLYPKLDLDPYPDFDRLCKKPTTVKLNLDFHAMRRKRLRQTSVPEKSNLGTDQPNVASSSTQHVGQRTAMGPPNSVNRATQAVGQRQTMHQLTQNVPRLPTLDQLTRNVHQIPPMNQLTQNVRQRRAMDQPNVVNLATQNVGQCNTTVPSPINHAPSTSVPRFPWESHQPKDQLGVETSGNMQSHAPGTSFNAPGASSTHALVNLSSDDDDIDSFVAGFQGGRGNQGSRQSLSMSNLDHRNRSNTLGASISAPGASSTHAMQSASSIMSAFDRQSSSMANSNIRNWSDSLALIDNHQKMTLEALDNTPGTAFNRLRASNTRSMSFPLENDGRRFTSAFNGRTANQDGQSSFPMAHLEGRSRSNPFVFLGNQQQQQPASHMQYNAAQTSVNAPGASSSHGTSSVIPFDGNKGNQVGHSSSLVNMENGNWSNPLADIFNHHQNTSATTFTAPGASSTNGTMSLNSNNNGISSVIPFDDGKMGNQDVSRSSSQSHVPDHAQQTAVGAPGASSTHGTVDLTSEIDHFTSLWFGLDDKSGNQDGQSSSMANADNGNQSNPLAIVGTQQQQIASYMQNDTSSQLAANLPEGFSAQGTVNMSSDNDFDISAILADIEANHSSPMANNTDNNQSNPLASNSNQPKQQIAANQPHGMVSSGSDNDCLWSAMSAFANKKGHQEDGESSSMAGSSHIDKQSNAIAPTQRQYRFEMLDAISRKPNTGHQGASYNIEPEPLESDRLHPSFPPQLTRSTFLQAPWNNRSTSTVKEEPLGSSRGRRSVFASVPIDYITIEDDEPVERRSSSRPPKSGESSSEAARRQNRAEARSSSQTERSVVNSVPAVGGSQSSSTHNIWSNAEGGGFWVQSPSTPITDAINSLIQTSDAKVLTSHSVSIGQGLSMQQQLDFNPVSQMPTPILQQQQSQRRQGNMMTPGNVGGSQASGNVRRGAPRGQRISQGKSSNAGGDLQVPPGSRGRGSRGRGSRGRGSRGRGSRSLGEFGEQSSNTNVARIGDMNIDSSLITGSGSAGSSSHGLLGSNARNPMTVPRFMTEMSQNHQNQNRMQQQTNLPPTVSASVGSGISRRSGATNQGGTSGSIDWIDDDFMRNLMK